MTNRDDWDGPVEWLRTWSYVLFGAAALVLATAALVIAQQIIGIIWSVAGGLALLLITYTGCKIAYRKAIGRQNYYYIEPPARRPGLAAGVRKFLPGRKE
jgi:hypothetical protein